jgi:hypothetical protein
MSPGFLSHLHRAAKAIKPWMRNAEFVGDGGRARVYHCPVSMTKKCRLAARTGQAGGWCEPIQRKPGQPEQFDYECLRNDAANQFKISDPLLG